MRKNILSLVAVFSLCFVFFTASSWAVTSYSATNLVGTWNVYLTGCQITKDTSVYTRSYVDDAWWAYGMIVAQSVTGVTTYVTVKSGSIMSSYSNAYGTQTITIIGGRIYVTSAGIIGGSSYVDLSMMEEGVRVTHRLYIRHATLSTDKLTFMGVHNLGTTSTARLPFGTITGMKRI